MSKLTLVMLIFTFIVFAVWLSIDLFRTEPSVQTTPELEQALQPINPTFDQETLDQIQNLGSIPAGTARPIDLPTASGTPQPSVITTPVPTTPPATPQASVTPPPNINFGFGTGTESENDQ